MRIYINRIRPLAAEAAGGHTLDDGPPSIGWRYFNFDDQGLLRAAWGSRETWTSPHIVAACGKYGCKTVPAPGCHCGIHFVADGAGLLEYSAEVIANGFQFPVGLVEPTGRVLAADHETTFGREKVWRAESVQLRALVIPRESVRFRSLLNTTYGVPVHAIGLTPISVRIAEGLYRHGVGQ